MSRTKRLLFVALHRPGRSPSQRFRFEQFLPFLQENGWQCDYAYMLDEQDDQAFYTPGAYFQKARIVLKGFKKRLADLQSADEYDVIFIQRESFVSGSTYFERMFARSKAKIIFDFDDAIWLLDVSEANRNLRWLKDPSKTRRIISLADHVIAGNRFLADYAGAFNQNVSIIPTVIDTKYYQSAFEDHGEQVTIGWTGSQTTIKHLMLAEPIFSRLHEKYGDRIRFAAITERPIEMNGTPVDQIPWEKSKEVSSLDQIDIGIMPLPDEDWSRGKCGFKGIQYMSLNKPAVMSPVGVNPEIVSDGKDGFLPNTEDEWVERLSELIESKSLREAMGAAARQTIINRYSVDAVKQNLLDLLNELSSHKSAS